MTGLATGGAAIAIGIIAASTTRSTRSALAVPPTRRLALIFTAFAEGSGVWGVVVGLLAIFRGALDAPAATSIIAPVLAITGAAVAFAVMTRSLADLDLRSALTAVMFIIGLAVLALAVAVLAITIHVRGHAVPETWPFATLGVVIGGSVIGLGATGARSIRSVAALDDAAAVAVSSRAIARCLPFQVVAIGASVIAIVLVVRS